MTEAAQIRLERRQTDREKLQLEYNAASALQKISEKCRIAFDNLESPAQGLTLSELAVKIFSINDCWSELEMAKAKFENAKEDSEVILPDTPLEKSWIEIYRGYHDPLPGYQNCKERIEPLLKSLFVRIKSEQRSFVADFKFGYQLKNRVALDGTLRIICGSAQMTLSQPPLNGGEKCVSLYLDDKPSADASQEKLSLLLQLSMEIAQHYAAVRVRFKCSYTENSPAMQQTLQAYKFTRNDAYNEVISDGWVRDFGTYPPETQILGHPENLAIFKDYQLFEKA
ncbi:MAG: hypothetical protein JSR58_04385 [Verrucomicrobia bacterium]|nr:hypothetical protein [Verrucomicrobiota bacterium]